MESNNTVIEIDNLEINPLIGLCLEVIDSEYIVKNKQYNKGDLIVIEDVRDTFKDYTEPVLILSDRTFIKKSELDNNISSHLKYNIQCQY